MSLIKRVKKLEATLNPVAMEPILIEVFEDDLEFLIGLEGVAGTYVKRIDDESPDAMSQRWLDECFTKELRQKGFQPFLWGDYDYEKLRVVQHQRYVDTGLHHSTVKAV